MVRWPRQHGLWLTLAALAALLVALALLQYRWIGEIGRAEAERRQAQLERSAHRFVASLDRELAQVLLTMRPGPGPERDRAAELIERFSAWTRGEHSPLVSRLLLAVRKPTGELALQSCPAPAGGTGCGPVSWPPALEPLRERLSAPEGEPGGPQGMGVWPGELLEEPLAVLMPVIDMAGPASLGERWARPRLAGLAIAELDGTYLREQLLPQLAEAQFGPLRESEFVVAILRRSDRSVLYSSDPSVRLDGSQQGDLQLALPGFRRALLGGDGQPGDEARWPGARLFLGRLEREGRRRPPHEDPWLLIVRHRGGSLEQAVTAVRRRNLAVGLGVLALLGAAGVVLATGAQRARRLARQQLEFVAGVTHELNTPLAAIRSAGQNLADGIVTSAAQVRRYGSLIDKEGGRLTALVAQILDFAGIESGSRVYAWERVSLCRLVDEVLSDLRLVLEQSGLRVETEIPAELPALRGDPAALRRVLANLLTNAAKFASSGGRVAVRVQPRADGRSVVVRVEDRGPGIPPAERAKAFEPFYRGSAAQRNDLPGSGLGLSLVRRVVAAHGGRSWIEDAAGGGAAVVVELPTAPPAQEGTA